MAKYIACGLVLAILITFYSGDPIGEMIKGILAGIFTYYILMSLDVENK